MNQERKRYPRGRVELDVTITSLGCEWRGKTADLSPYGVKIMLEPTSVPLETGTRVELRLPLPGAPPMCLAANVERVDLEDGAALTFAQVTEWQCDRLKEFVDAPLRRDCQELPPDMQPGQPPYAGSEVRPGTPPAERELAASQMGVSLSAEGGGSVPREPVSRGDDRLRDGGGWRTVLDRLKSVLAEERRVPGSARGGRQDERARHQERGTVGQGGDGARGGIRRTPPPPVTVVVPTGDLDMESAPIMRQKLEEHLNAGEIRMVLDLEGVPYIDSAGLGEVVRAMKRAREVGGDLRLYGLRREVLRIFELTGLDKAMQVYPTRGEAVASWR